MTQSPRGKAINIINCCMNELLDFNQCSFEDCKELAIKITNEMIDNLNKLWSKYSCDCLGFELNYWQQVKTEIENL